MDLTAFESFPLTRQNIFFGSKYMSQSLSIKMSKSHLEISANDYFRPTKTPTNTVITVERVFGTMKVVHHLQLLLVVVSIMVKGTEASLFDFLRCFVVLFRGSCRFSFLPVSVQCAGLNSTLACTQDYDPVICDDACKYNNHCEAISAGYNVQLDCVSA